MEVLLFAAGAYLLGCVPAARLIRLLAGDSWWGPPICAAVDFAKGYLAVVSLSPALTLGQCLAATAVVAGHQWPPMGRGRGERGIAVAGGAVCAITPIAGPLWAVLWGAFFVIAGYVPIASALASVLVVPALGIVAGWPIAFMVVPPGAMVLERLREDVRRVLKGGEPKYLWRVSE